MLMCVETHLPRCHLGCLRVDGVTVSTQFGSPLLNKGCSGSKSSTRDQEACSNVHTLVGPGGAQVGQSSASRSRGYEGGFAVPPDPRLHLQFRAPNSAPPPSSLTGPASKAGRSGLHCCPSSVNTSLPAPRSPRTAPLPGRGGDVFPRASKTSSVHALLSFFPPNLRTRVCSR